MYSWIFYEFKNDIETDCNILDADYTACDPKYL